MTRDAPWTEAQEREYRARHDQAVDEFHASGMSVRLINCLLNARCYTIDDTLRHDDAFWLNRDNFGKISLRELKAHQGDRWRSGEEDWW